MGWYGPDQCEEHCCEPPTPCTKPIVTCKKSDDPQKFEYTIADADEAWIDETCPSSGGSVVTSYAIALTSRAAAGYYNTLPGCTYCVRAVNACGTTVCCDVCTMPTCSLAVTRSAYGELVIVWSYNSNSLTDLVVSAEVGGIDVFAGATGGSGTMTVPISSLDLESAVYSGVTFNDLVLTVTNDCGSVSKCRFTIPCCWEKTQTRVSISGLADTYTEKIDAVTRTIGSHSQFSNKHSMRIEGLAALNGTHFLDNALAQSSQATTTSFCDASTNFIEVGAIKVTESVVANGREFSIFPFRDWDYTIDWVVEFTAYLGYPINPTVPPGATGYGGGIYYRIGRITINDLLTYHPNGTSPGFSVPRSITGCSRTLNPPFTEPCVNDGGYRAYPSGIGFFGNVIPAQTDGGMTGIQKQPVFSCNNPQTRDFFAPSYFASIQQFPAFAFNGGVTALHCRLDGVIFPDAVELEYV